VQCRSQNRDARPEGVRVGETRGRSVQINRGAAVAVDDSQRPVIDGLRGGRFIEESEQGSCFIVRTAAEDIVDSSHHGQKAVLVRRAERGRGRGRKVCLPLAVTIAGDYALLGETEKAFDWLERALREREHDLMYLNVDDRFAALRSDPRFQNLLHLIGLG
jgi:hypothetical protein